MAFPQIENARHYISIQVQKLVQGKMQLGLALASHTVTNSLNDIAAYECTGVIVINNREIQGEPYAQGDIIGVYLDAERKLIRFFKNGEGGPAQALNLEAGKPYCFAVCFESEGQEVLISKAAQPPEELDIMGTKQDVSGNAANWGYKFKVSPVFIGKNRMNQLLSLNEKQMEKWNAYQEHYRATFTRLIDEQVVQYIDDFANSSSKDPLKISRGNQPEARRNPPIQRNRGSQRLRHPRHLYGVRAASTDKWRRFSL